MFSGRNGLRFLASLVVAVLLVLCVGSVAHAAMAGAQAEDCVNAACQALLACPSGASGHALPSAHHPIAIPSVAGGGVRPEAMAAAVVVSPPGAVPERPVVPLAPRSPPAAS